MNPTTTIAAPSNGATLPQATLNVASTTGFPSAGTVKVFTTTGMTLVGYTGLTATTFTGCTGGAGTLATGQSVIAALTLRQQLWARAATDPASPVPALMAHGASSLFGSDATPAVPPGAVAIDAPWGYLELDSEVAVPGSNVLLSGIARWRYYDDEQAGYIRTRAACLQTAQLYTEEWLGDGLIDAISGEYLTWFGLPRISGERGDQARQQNQQWIDIEYRKTYSGGGP